MNKIGLVSSKKVSSKPVFIYGLADPDTNEVRYIGKTVKKLSARLRGHIGDSKKRNHRSANWIKSCIENGKEPEIFEIDIVDVGDDWVEAEQFWIAMMRYLGCDLTNHAIGGQGTDGYKFTEEQIKKLSDSHKGIGRSKEALEKHAETMKKKKELGWVKKGMTSEQMEKRLVTLKKNHILGLHKQKPKATQEQKLKNSIARKEWDSPESRKKISDGVKKARAEGRGHFHRSQEALAKQAETLRKKREAKLKETQ